jgi:acyl-CoA thioesterase FadM
MGIFKFSIPVIVQAQDISHRAHVACQNFFIYFQAARTAYLEQFGCTENDIFG